MAPTWGQVVFVVMKTSHAFGFLLVGSVMFFIPAFIPDHFFAGAGGVNTSELWLLLMGAAQMIMGTWSIGQNVVPQLSRQVADWEPALFNLELADVSWVLPEAFYAALDEVDEVSLALSLQQQLRMGYAA